VISSGRVVWFFTFPRAELLDLAGPWAVLGHANDVLGRHAYQPIVVSTTGGTISTRHELAIAGTKSLKAARRGKRPHTIVVAGGMPSATLPDAESRLARWLRLHHREVPRIVSICTGAFVLGSAGLLDGHRVTTHWAVLDTLVQLFPRAKVVNDGIFQRDGRLWTSAGVTAGIDLTLALVEEDHGHATAMTVAGRLLLYLRRTGGQAQFSEALQRQHDETPRLRDLTTFVVGHLDERLPVERLAQHLGVSVRTLTRWIGSELSLSPAAFVRRLRTEEARRLLADTDLSFGEVCARTGLGDQSTLFRVFSQDVGISPADYRNRFRRVAKGDGNAMLAVVR
jgi:transcriptional regulator GlxA family with amidase domain